MTDFINYAQILTDFYTTLQSATLINGLAFTKVFKNAEDMDYEYGNMPMADCRLKRAVPLNTAGDTYYSDIVIEVEIACFDMTERDVCATMRDNLTNAVQRVFQLNPHFSAYVDTVQIGVVNFETGENKAEGEFIAAAVAEFHVKLYSQV